MSGGSLGIAGDVLSVAFLCFLCSLAIQLYCAFSRRTSRPPAPLPASIRSPSTPHLPSAARKQLYLLRLQRSASCPIVSAVAPPLSPPNKLSSSFHVSPLASRPPASDVSPLACPVSSQAHTADLAKLMQLEGGEEHDVDMEGFLCVPPPRQLFTIEEEEGKDEEDASEQSSLASDTSAEGNRRDSVYGDAPAAAELCEKSKPLEKCTGATYADAGANGSAKCAYAPAAGLVSQVSSASSEGGVSLWSSTSPGPSSPALSYLSASSSPFPASSPPRSSSSFWPQTSRFSNAAN